MDLACFWREQIEKVLIKAFHINQLRREININRIRQIWSDIPAWYFWLGDSKSVYRYGLETYYEDYSCDIATKHGIFSIKYYPHTSSPYFNSFSKEEKELIQSSSFNAENIPTFDLQDLIPTSYYNIAAIEHVLDDYKSFHLIQLDCLEWTNTKTKSGDKLSVLRRLPSFFLSYKLFASLVSLNAYYYAISPSNIKVYINNGFEYIIDDGKLEHQFDPDIIRFSFFVFFNFIPGSHRISNYLENIVDNNNSKLILSYVKANENSFIAGDYSNYNFLDDNWWILPRSCFSSELTSLCGCSHDH